MHFNLRNLVIFWDNFSILIVLSVIYISFGGAQVLSLDYQVFAQERQFLHAIFHHITASYFNGIQFGLNRWLFVLKFVLVLKSLYRIYMESLDFSREAICAVRVQTIILFLLQFQFNKSKILLIFEVELVLREAMKYLVQLLFWNAYDPFLMFELPVQMNNFIITPIQNSLKVIQSQRVELVII